MAIVTLCPQCQTAFAIQAEHYSAADAWVRCGRCAHVFEVDQHLFELDDPTPAPVPVIKSEMVHARVNASSKPTAISTIMWDLMAFSLVLLLGFQMLLQQRHQIRGMNPELSPLLSSMCQTLSCELHWPMQPDRVSMESGSFKHLGGQDYAFEGVIKNQSDGLMTAPALELSLTDEIDMPVIRKVMTPDDMRLTSPLRDHRTQSFEVRFSLEPQAAAKITGYRAFLFYP